MKVSPGMVALCALVTLASGCSGSAVDSSCDVEGISHEVEHMVSESQMEMGSLAELKCADGWTFARATVRANGEKDQSSTFLFQKTDAGWFLRDPASACAADAGTGQVPDSLKQEACAAQ